MLKKSFTSFFQESYKRPTKKKYWSPKKTKNVKENTSTFKNHYQLINEGGQAAENLIVDLKKASGNENLKYTRAQPSSEVIDEVQRLLTILRSKNFINSREPSYYLGSSRLFAIKAGISVQWKSSKSGKTVTGEVTKVGRKFVVVREHGMSFSNWRVPANMLEVI